MLPEREEGEKKKSVRNNLVSTKVREGEGGGPSIDRAEISSAACREDYGGAGIYFLKELQPMEDPGWSRSKV